MSTGAAAQTRSHGAARFSRRAKATRAKASGFRSPVALVAKRNLTMQSAMQSEVGASGPLPCVPVINGHQHRRGTESLQTHRWRRQSRANSSLKGNSLLAGKIQGNSSILASSVHIFRRKHELDQMLTVKI